MSKEKEKKHKDALKQRSTVETLKFQTLWGFKNQFGKPKDLQSLWLEAELEYIIELRLEEDLLSIKGLVENIKATFRIEPLSEAGDFCNSIVANSLGIAKTVDINNIGTPTAWHDMIKKKILSIYYPNDIRNQVFDYAKSHNYNTSTYLGEPIVKFKQIYIMIKGKKNTQL